MTAQAIDDNNHYIPGIMRPTFSKRIVAGVGTAGPFKYGTVVRIATDALLFIRFQSTSTGTASSTADLQMPSGAVEYFKTGADEYIVATGTGTANICTMS
jgi:hypothetical protein